MLSSIFTIFLALFVHVSMSQTPANAIQKSYIVYMGEHDHGPKLTKEDLHKVSDSHIDFLGSYLGSKEKAKEAMFYSYRRYINGFAANFDENVANEIAKNPNVVSVFLNQHYTVHTTHSWDFLSLENNNVVPESSLWKKAKFGEDIIIGNLDTGVWPESKSFSDEGYGPIPSRWKGFCQKDADPTFSCNRKLIGAKYFKEGFENELQDKLNSSLYSPRDLEGHGTHTLSTAGGNNVSGVSLGVGKYGTAKGGAPRARVATYKVCWTSPKGTGYCNSADILKAFDHAIYDGVDVISASFGFGPTDYMKAVSAIGAMNAVKHGIVVVMSAGNSGPTAGTVGNVAPWIITVGASTIGREFHNYIELGNGLQLKGTSITTSLPENRLYPLVSGAQAKAINASPDAALLCEPGMLDPEKVKGKILVCLRGGIPRLEKGIEAANAGAVGMIVCNDEAHGDSIDHEFHFLPASLLTYKDGLAVFAYINSTTVPMGFIKATEIQVHTKPAPIMADFSSKGPNTITPEILKPDITAPGVDIIAAYTEAVSPTIFYPEDARRVPYYTMSGTSMSCPHVAGVVALLKAIYPKWSPAAIRSAIMTTAITRDNSARPMLNASHVKSNPFEYGAGHIRPDRAADPGLIYDLHMEDYLNFLCVIGYNQSTITQFYRKSYQCPPYSDKISLINLNYPSITVPNLKGTITVTRTVKNVGAGGTYVARVRQPRGVLVSVQPKVLEFKKTSDEKSFNITLTAKTTGVAKDYVFGALVWTDGVHTVRSPITVSTA